MVVSWVFCCIGLGSDRVLFEALAIDGEVGGFISNGFHFWGALTTMWNVRTSGGKW